MYFCFELTSVNVLYRCILWSTWNKVSGTMYDPVLPGTIYDVRTALIIHPWRRMYHSTFVADSVFHFLRHTFDLFIGPSLLYIVRWCQPYQPGKHERASTNVIVYISFESLRRLGLQCTSSYHGTQVPHWTEAQKNCQASHTGLASFVGSMRFSGVTKNIACSPTLAWRGNPLTCCTTPV